MPGSQFSLVEMLILCMTAAGAVLEQQVVVREGSRRGRVEVAQVKTGQRTARRAAELARMQHDIHTRHVLFAQNAHHLVADRVEQRRASLVRRGERSHGFALLNKLRRRTVYRAVQTGKILRLDQLAGDIGGAVDDLLVQDLLRIAVQARGEAAQRERQQKHGDLDREHGDKREKDRAEYRSLAFFFPSRFLFFMRMIFKAVHSFRRRPFSPRSS